MCIYVLLQIKCCCILIVYRSKGIFYRMLIFPAASHTLLCSNHKLQGNLLSGANISVLQATLRKHSYSNIEYVTTNIWKFSDKKMIFFYISAQNIDCEYTLEPPRRGGSNEYPQSMFLLANKKNNVYSS